MLNTIKSKLRFLKYLVGSLSDKPMMGNDEDGPANVSIQKEVRDNRVGRHLVNGEITQEVEELRYRTYEVADESKYYKYIGDGEAKKLNKKIDNTDISKKIVIFQENRYNTETVLDGLKQIETNKWTKESYTLNISYSSMPKFKIEANVKAFRFISNKDVRKIELHIDTLPSGDQKSRPFLNELEKLFKNQDEYSIKRSDFSLIEAFSFITNNANGESDMVSYILTNISFDCIEKEDDKYVVKFDFGEFERSNLKDKFYSEEMAAKYSAKMPKNTHIIDVKDLDDTEICPKCGKRMPKIDAYVIEEECGETMCQECYKKYLFSKI